MAAIGAVAGVAFFCTCEVLPYAVRRLRRKVTLHRRRSHQTGSKGEQLSLPWMLGFENAIKRLRRGSQSGALADIVHDENIVALVVAFLRTSEACILRACSPAVRRSSWGEFLSPKIHLFGGQSANSTSAERLDLLVGEWEACDPMPHGRFWAAGVAAAGRFYLCGGSTGQGALRAFDCFDPDLSTWKSLPSMHYSRNWPTCCAIAGCVYVCGGIDGQQVLRAVESYDIELNQWESLEFMSIGRYGATAAALGGYVIACGGCGAGSDLDSVERFDPRADQWTDLASMVRCRRWSTSAVLRGALYVCGGRCGEHALPSIERFHAASNHWEMLSSMSLGRYGAVSTVLGGVVYVMGGRDRQSVLRSVEVFHPEHGWMEGPRLLEGRVWSVGAAFVEGKPRERGVQQKGLASRSDVDWSLARLADEL